ncbi:MAG: shikimate dehydrogenase [Neptuniibacter caesariensis]|uniref:Shikimate dehydrogenase (NADP(+)) n=1 Tax=Neptuniibacter caesariensis TaxID=207954 RepID=A0A2G6JAI7_NEPCE|nr:MAG: shikimate dehydrogenase [Neptuniibacter caesariensis]
MTDRYAVFGNPVKHSKSPQIHAAFAESTAQDLTYEAICVPEDAFAENVKKFLSGSGRGLNITLPFKQDAWALAEVLSPRAKLAGAVNTLYRDEQGRICGDNTDGIGMVRDIMRNNQGEIAGKRVLILGAGGAVCGVLQPILEQRPARLVIANRTAAKAEELAARVSGLADVMGCGYDTLQGQSFDLVINGTAASLQGEVPPLPPGVLAEGAWCYDMMYGAEPTAFCLWAQEHGAAKALDGLGMLVEQAAQSFLLWRGVEPDSQTVIKKLRQELCR